MSEFHHVSVLLEECIEAKEFSKIYAVDMEQPRIKAPELKSVLRRLRQTGMEGKYQNTHTEQQI